MSLFGMSNEKIAIWTSHTLGPCHRIQLFS